ncbi:MAG: PaaI family thioesterase [Rhizobacter sp.]
MSDAPEPSVPEGFTPLKRGGPYFAQLGPLYHRKVEDGTAVLGLRVEARHTNMIGITHGGMLVTFADGALGINLSIARNQPRSVVTVHLSTDFIDSARPGDWLEAHVRIRKVGRRLAFADCELRVGERAILSCSGVFASIQPPGEPVHNDG